MSFKRLLFVLVAVLPLVTAGCNKKPKVKNCTVDSECKYDASGKEINGLCHNGLCQECVTDANCKDLKQCVQGRCLSSCQSDMDCSEGSHCNNNFCVDNCTSDDSCAHGEICSQGHCVNSSAGLNGGEASASADCRNLSKIRFDFDSYEIKGESRDVVAQVGRCMKENPNLSLTVEGHTDDRGTSAYNIVLGEQRAKATKTAILESSGIDSSRIKTVSYGDQRPEASGSSEYAWGENRRAMFILGQN